MQLKALAKILRINLVKKRKKLAKNMKNLFQLAKKFDVGPKKL